jgi:RimJ/RimL family protein N-acetyltransferase
MNQSAQVGAGDHNGAMEKLPSRVQSERLTIRQWEVEDAEALSQAIIDSYEHLRPWMGWVDMDEARDVDGYRARIGRWADGWKAGGDSSFGIFNDDILVGACGLHRRGTTDSLEIGYWVHAGHTGLGYATEAAAAVTRAALDLPGIGRVEIHHDKANVASGRIPPRIGYEFAGEWPRDKVAPAEIGIEWRWVITRSD